jgi:hypothetical protein
LLQAANCRDAGLRKRTSVVDAGHVAVLLVRDAGNAHEQIVADQRHIGHRLHIDQITLPVADLDRAGLIALRFGRVDLDRAALGIRPRQRSLRTAQDLDALQVQQGKIRTREAGVVDVVNVDADTRREGGIEVALPDAADRGGHARTKCTAGFDQRHIGSLLGEIMQRALAALLHHRGVYRGDCQRHRLQVLPAKLRGHHDFLEAARVLRRGSIGCCSLSGGHRRPCAYQRGGYRSGPRPHDASKDRLD